MAISINTSGGDYEVLLSPVFTRGLRATVNALLVAIKYYEDNRKGIAEALSPDVVAILDTLLVIKPVLIELSRLLRERSS